MAMLSRLSNCAFVIREFIAPSYRPERHYMRGPGPKWHAKHPYGMADGSSRPGRTR